MLKDIAQEIATTIHTSLSNHYIELLIHDFICINWCSIWKVNS